MADKQRIPHKEVTQAVVSASPINAIPLRDEGVHAYLKEVPTMAGSKRIPLDEALRVILSSDGDNPFRDMLELIVQSALEAEMSAHLEAEPYERNQERTGYRSGHRPRVFTTRVGDLELLVPQDRDGTFSTALFECFQRSEKALALAMMEMYVQGVSTRKVAAITEELCGRAFSSQQVSKLAKGLDEKVDEWRNRPIEGKHTYLIVDATYQKVRRGGRVISQGVLIAMGISSKGMREILSVVIADTENETTWSDLFRDLKARGLSGIQLVTSDNHEGIKKAAMRHFQGATWQRCQCHFIKNVLDMAGSGQKADLHADLRHIRLRRHRDAEPPHGGDHPQVEREEAGGGEKDRRGDRGRARMLLLPRTTQKEDKDHQRAREAQRGDKEEDPGCEDLPQRGLSSEAHRDARHGEV